MTSEERIAQLEAELKKEREQVTRLLLQNALLIKRLQSAPSVQSVPSVSEHGRK